LLFLCTGWTRGRDVTAVTKGHVTPSNSSLLDRRNNRAPLTDESSLLDRSCGPWTWTPSSGSPKGGNPWFSGIFGKLTLWTVFLLLWRFDVSGQLSELWRIEGKSVKKSDSFVRGDFDGL